MRTYWHYRRYIHMLHQDRLVVFFELLVDDAVHDYLVLAWVLGERG